MNLENILAVTGMPGLYRLVTTRNNGLIIEDFDSGKRTFISLRKHQFTPLESVGIYTYTDVVDLPDVFLKIQSSGAEIPESGAAASDYHKFLREVLPEYDEDRVYLSDIKKLAKWYAFLDAKNLLVSTESDEEE
jgi:uncharacterized protein DUF6852/uncharacterized protein DUF5606